MTSDELIVADAWAWRAWLDASEHESDGVMLVLAKKGTTEPTTLSYAEALDEALCSGWIDGQRRSRDAGTFLQRFTPRRPRSIWSQRNVGHIERLIAEGRMRPRGLAEVELAQADGRWQRAYAGPAAAEIPEDLLIALAAVPAAHERFHALKSQERYAHLHTLMTASSDEVRARRLARIVAALERD